MNAGIGRRIFLAAMLAAAGARALGRIPSRGLLKLRVPWPLSEIDPHDLSDPGAAFFGSAVFDTLYAIDTDGRAYPALAANLPESVPGGARIVLRPGLVTARGLRLDAREVAWSLQRARRLGANALLGSFGNPEADASNPLIIRIPKAAPADLALALSSPVTSVMSRSSSPTKPDGTGAFVATPARGKLLLGRNASAARGGSFLDRIEVTSARDLADGLRAFEAGEVDVGWLGAGLHRPRTDATPFTTQSLGFIVLRTGAEAKTWSTPGIAQRLIDGIAPEHLLHLGLGARSEYGQAAGWGGGPANLLVPEGAAYLAEIARVFSAVVSRPGHEITVTAAPSREFRDRRAQGRYALMLDIVRRFGPTARDGLLALLASVDPGLARRPPELTNTSPERLSRMLPLGVFGELRVAGAHAPTIHGLSAWNLGSVYRE